MFFRVDRVETDFAVDDMEEVDEDEEEEESAEEDEEEDSDAEADDGVAKGEDGAKELPQATDKDADE